MKPILKRCEKFPPNGYTAITIFPFIFYKRQLSEETLKHETCHYYQELGLGVILFYVLYGLFYIVGLVVYRNHDEAYYNIPFEMAAYDVEDKDVSVLEMLYGWIKYIKDAYKKD